MSTKSIWISIGIAAAIALTIGAATRSRADDPAAPLQGGAVCGDGRCSPPEDCDTCARDCGDCCGDRRCAPPEDRNSCPRDCGDCCGDRRCAPPEDCNSCPGDCGRC